MPSREAGVDVPILVLSEQPVDDLPGLAAHGLTPTVTTLEAIEALAALRVRGLGVHLKIDTGMHRVGAHPVDAKALVGRASLPTVPGCGWTACTPTSQSPTRSMIRTPDASWTASTLRWPSCLRCPWCMSPTRRARWPIQVRAGPSCAPASRCTGISPGPGVDHLAAELRPVMTLEVTGLVRQASGRQ